MSPSSSRSSSPRAKEDSKDSTNSPIKTPSTDGSPELEMKTGVAQTNFESDVAKVTGTENPDKKDSHLHQMPATESKVTANGGFAHQAVATDTRDTTADVSNVIEVENVPHDGMNTTCYHPDADLSVHTLDASGAGVFYEVVASQLATASAVWRQLIYGGDHSRPDSGRWIIDMLEDNTAALDVLFQIVHYKFHNVPVRPDVDQLYEIAKVAEKYECTHLLVPWMKEFVAGLNWHVVMAKDQNDDEKTLYLTWILGEGRWFSRVISRVAHTATTGDDGTLLNVQGEKWDPQNIPSDILGIIGETRKQTIKNILNAVVVPVNQILKGHSRHISFCHAQDEGQRDACESLQMGSAIKALARAGFWPSPDPETYTSSVVQLAQVLETLKFSKYSIPGVKPHLDEHRACGLGHVEAIRAAMEAPTPLTRSIVTRLTQRGQISGAYDAEVFKNVTIVAREKDDLF